MESFEIIFNQAENTAMAFLEKEYSFRRVEKRVTGKEVGVNLLGLVTYEEKLSWYKYWNKKRFITLSIAPYVLELDLDIGRGRNRQEYYTIYELHQLEGVGQFPPGKYGLYKAMENAEMLLSEFERLVDVLKACGQRFFNSDNTLWEDLEKQRNTERQKQIDSNISLDADKAFKANKWDEVVCLLDKLDGKLSKLEKARLEYARKKV